MAQKKANEVDGWLACPDQKIRVVLLYGPDRGLVSERARSFARHTGLPLDDPFSVVKLEASEVEKDPGRLFDEARTVAMFTSRRLVWILNVGNHKGLADSIKELIAHPPEDALVLLEAGDLKKGTALRTAAEAGATSVALPCYADGDRSIDRVIDEELARAELSITAEARQLLKNSLGADRLASRSEVEKLVLYCQGRGKVEADDVRASSGDVSAFALDDAVDAVLEGNPDQLDHVYTRMSRGGIAPAGVLSATMRQFHALSLMRQALDAGRSNAAAIVAAARPPVFFSRRRTVEKALSVWSSEAMTRALDRLQATILETRRRPELAMAATRQSLLALTLESRSRMRANR